MALPAVIRRFIAYLWHGPSTLPRALQLEWRFVAVRWMGIIFMAPGLLLMHLATPREFAAYLVLILAGLYNLAVQLMMGRSPALFASGYITAIGDGMLNIAMINVGSGFNSPFYYLLFTVTIAAAMRFGYGPSLATVSIYIFLDILETQPASHASMLATFFFRSGFLLITAVLAGYLREQAQRAEAALQERLRQADLLNEATAMLGASLEFETVLHAVTAAACHLLGGASAVLQSSSAVHGPVADTLVVFYPVQHSMPTALHEDLAALCAHYAHTEAATRGGPQVFQRTALPSGQQAIVLTLTLPTRQAALATLALTTPPGEPLPALDSDILDSFVERTTLAIENASLYRTLASRSTDLQRAYGDLAAAHQELLSIDEMKTNFLANVSHELRTPLSSIRSFSELLLSYDDANVQQEFLQIINSESERLTRLVNDVLDITKIEAGKMDWDRRMVDVGALLRDSARIYGTLIKEHNLAFEQEISDDLPRIYADRDRLQQVISNLLNNAMKFTPHGAIRLSGAYADGAIRIAVADTGIGIAAEDRERIFEKFQQVGDTLTDKPKGTGLGLCICRDIVAYHDGRLWVDSTPGQGSTFTVSLPVTDAAANPATQAAA